MPGWIVKNLLRLLSGQWKFFKLAKNNERNGFLPCSLSAVRAGNEINQGFKKKIFDASQVVNGLSEKIITQKSCY